MALAIAGLDLDSILSVPEQIASTVTDAVTHALGQVVNVDVSQPVPTNTIAIPINPPSGGVVAVGGFKGSVEHGLTVAIQTINVVLSVGFFLPANYKVDLIALRTALQHVYSWLG
jgi:hypothetical protein